MSYQSYDVYHIYCTNDLDFALDSLDLELDGRSKIEDLDKFKRQLQNANLWNDKLEEFLDNYLRFDNN
jgi:hypothetical protein